MVYYCKPCDAYVGCHNNTEKALGIMANKELRELRQKVHAYIDPYWKSGDFKRGQVYYQISKEIGKPYHTGESDIDMCNKILNLPIHILLYEGKIRKEEKIRQGGINGT